METELSLLKFTFPAAKGRPQHATKTAYFAGKVHHAFAVIKGFDLGYNEGDHHLYRFVLDTHCLIDGNGVAVTVTYGLRDSSGDFDDAFNGLIDILVIALRD